ncbi:hypothetical protein ACVBEE_08595 [Acinetobacter sp. ANC 3781]
MKIKSLHWKSILFYLTVVITVFMIMNGTYLPMVDLPQHAAQVATLDDLLKNQSIWGHLVETNFKTPYLVGYFSWLFIYQFFDILTSSKIFISIIFLIFVYAFDRLRKTLNASALVSWIAIPSFFGFCYEWGFVTFLLATAIGLLFFTANIKWVNQRKKYQSIFIILLGIFLFFSHVLSFVFFCLLSFVYIAVNVKSIKPLLNFIPAYFIFFLLLVFYLTRADSLSVHYSYGADVKFHSLLEKIKNLVVYPWSGFNAQYLESLFLILVPFLAGYKLSNNVPRFIPLIVFLFVWLSLPHFLYNTFFIYERYSILFFGFYYLIFDEETEFKYHNFSFAIIFVLIASLLVNDYKSIIFAKKETQDFEAIIEKLPIKKRVLGAVFEPTGASIGIPFTYVHFASWYQAQKQGWSDFNFAWFHPQIIRYTSATVPEVKPNFEWMPHQLQKLETCQNYDLIFIRAYDASFSYVVLNSQCKNYKIIAQQGAWFVLSKN